MKIANEFTVSVPVEQAWAVLTDLEGIAPCLPGARLTGRDGDVHAGTITVKVGPVTSTYTGTAQFAEKDDTAHRAVIDAKGRDSRGAGTAAALITAQLTPDGGRTTVSVDTDLKISGKIAQFGGGIISEVSGKLLGQFVDCLEAKLIASESSSPAEPTPAAEPPPADAPPAEAPPANAPPAEAPAVASEPLDLMALTRGSVTKRLVPAAVVTAGIAVLIYLVRR